MADHTQPLRLVCESKYVLNYVKYLSRCVARSYHSEYVGQHKTGTVRAHFPAEFAQHAQVHGKVERREQHRSWLLHAQQTEEGPLAVELRNRPSPLEKGEHCPPHTAILALVGTAPLEESVENRLLVKLHCLLLYFEAIYKAIKASSSGNSKQ